MPIHCASPVVPSSKGRFHEIDSLVTGHAFGIHNEFGRLLDERAYQAALASRCRSSGLVVESEFRIRVQFEDFLKDYFVDLLIEAGTPVEVKAAEKLSAAHRAQMMNYLFGLDVRHGTLLNFRPASVEREFVSTTHTRSTRGAWSWHPPSSAGHCAEVQGLQAALAAILEDWGALLEVSLYREALIHFTGGAERVLRPVSLNFGGGLAGEQTLALITEDIALAVTGVTRSPGAMRDHLQRLLRLTNLRSILWVNFNQALVGFEELFR